MLRGIAKGGLYQVQSASQFSQASTALLCQSSSNKFESMFAYFPTMSCNPSGSLNSSDTVHHLSCKKAFIARASEVNVNLLHKRLGHPAFHTLKTILKSCTIGIFNKTKVLNFCSACQFGKSHLLHFDSVATKTTEPLQLLYADLWGPSHVTSTQDYSYYLSILDDFSRFTWIFPLAAKSDALQVFQTFKSFIEKFLNRNIKTVQTNWGCEFRSFSTYIAQSGIQFRHPCPYIHHQNDRIERKHRHVVDIGLTLLAQANLPLKFWWNAFHTAVFLINRLPTPTLNNISPYQKLFA